MICSGESSHRLLVIYKCKAAAVGACCYVRRTAAVATNQMAPREAAQRIVEHTTNMLKGNK